MVLVVMRILFITILLTDAGNCRMILRYINEQKTWLNASSHCRSLNGFLFSTSNAELSSLLQCDIYNTIEYPIWTGLFKSLSDWIEIRLCYETIKHSRKVNYDDLKITEYDCQQYCKGDINFAQGSNGECFCNVTVNEDIGKDYCDSDFSYRLYKEYNTGTLSTESDCTDDVCCLYTTCHISCSPARRSVFSTGCRNHKKVICNIANYRNESLSWYDAKSFCHHHDSMLRRHDTLGNDINDSWIGISRGYAYIYSENVMNPDPIECVEYNNTSLQNRSCSSSRAFVCKIDIENGKEIQTDDCNVHVPSTSTTSQPTDYSTTVTDSMSISTSSLPEIYSTKTSISTDNQSTKTSISTENKTPSTFYSTKNQTSTSILTEHQTTSNLISNEKQTISTSISTENDPLTTFPKPSSDKRQSGQFPTVIVGSVIGVVFIILSIVAVLFMVRRKKILSNKYRKHDRAEKTEKTEKDKTKGSPVGSSNVSGGKSDVYCDPWQSFEESQTLTKAGKKLNRQSQNPMYELNSSQYDSYSVAGGLTKPNNTEKYENVNLDIYNHCNVGDSKMAASQQNVYDSAAGIYSHLNHGGNTDHNEDMYDHFHGSDQDYDQFDRTLRNTEESEYSIYQ